MAVAEFPEMFEKPLLCWVDPSFPLEGFDQYRTGFGTDHFFRGGEVVKWSMAESPRQGAEALLVLGLSSRGNCG